MQKSSKHDALAAALRSVREKAGLSQRELAAKLGTNQTRISFIERGTQYVHVTEMIDWCAATGCDPVELLQAIIAG